MKKSSVGLLAVLTFLCISFAAYAQDDLKNGRVDNVYALVDHYPEYPGGVEAMFTYLDSAVEYPEEALNNDIEGVVYVRAVIDTDGKVLSVFTNSKLGGGLQDEALRVVQFMPRWKPGSLRGRKVRVLVIIPIRFQIGEEEDDDASTKKHHKRS